MRAGELTPQELRDLYLKGTLRQRYRIAQQRFDRAAVGPSELVNCVSALEGFSRAVAMRRLVQSGNALNEAYVYLRDKGVVELIAKHVCPAYQTSPSVVFGEAAWKQIPEAVAYRNLLIHEATFLNGKTCRRLSAATIHCFDRLAALAGAV
jgi:hypothetical protein